MAMTRSILGLVSLIILAGSLVMQFFIVLSGSHVSSPETKIYFLQADTTGITGGNSNFHNPARWTFLSVCGVTNGLNSNCGPTHAALPFDIPATSNFGTTTGVPAQFVGTHHYYFLSRFAWAFYIIALFFGVVAFFTSLLALCTRLGSYLTGLNCVIALFFQALAAALMTAWTVQARSAFQSNSQSATLGTFAYAFSWAPVACYIICTVLFCVGGSVGKGDKAGGHQKKSYFGRKRSTRSRGSFIDNESQRRVKDEYE